ncbi:MULTISPECIES: MarR family winged helix-turn-helix transcriptional regulator [Enterococcus]|uniref:HTH marR-type domain-containing protein n=1 Tax=Enterococcus sulfureus ATCC 49903 TaxID=1140003 RepID=S0KLH0_9ENTE|nr:MarR family transcriptional regulator [Enterococcus sulfureus]EOT45552.1 hypothetical protein OMY_02131 [Enterococcus sulfureus ATCC 49903]EOT83443.1 hypothetical protein I573_01993 [Enterococcus sulfureus ATCC 49903]
MSDTMLDKELCFQLYVASKEVIKKYKTYLDPYDLTYTGFIAMIALEDYMTVNQLGEILYLDSGTLSPLLKKLEKKGYLEKVRSKEDERRVELMLTPRGKEVKAELPCISEQVANSMDIKNLKADHQTLLTQLIGLNELFKA